VSNAVSKGKTTVFKLTRYRLFQSLAFALLCVVWGSTWLVIKVGYGGLGPFNVAAVRFVVAGTILLFVVPIAGAPWPKGRTEWLLVIWVGAIMFAADYGLIYWAERHIDSGLTAIIFAVLPVITSVSAHFYLETERLTAQKLFGTVIAFAGVVALFADRLAIDASQAWPMSAVLAGAFCATSATLAIKRHGSGLHPATLNASAMLVGAALLLIAALFAGERLTLPSDAATWGAVLYLAIVGSVVAFLAYFWLLKTWTATALSFINVVTPLVAVVLGFLFRNERLSQWTGLGAGLILGGVLFAAGRNTRSTKST
jgi:drug/metabolite transporter (DMT)-like permease